MTTSHQRSPKVLIGPGGKSRDHPHKLRLVDFLRIFRPCDNWFLGVDFVDYEVSSTLLSKNGVLQSRRGSRKNRLDSRSMTTDLFLRHLNWYGAWALAVFAIVPLFFL